MIEYMTIFLTNGETLRFEQVSELKSLTEKTIRFNYVSASTGKKLVAWFNLDSVAGMSNTV